MQGKLIVFEGVEGCGKTTQLQRLWHWLAQSGWLAQLQQVASVHEVIMTREPGGTALGKRVRQLLLTENLPEEVQPQAELLLYAADRAQHVETLLRPRLVAGALVLCDRFTDSTVAYQGYGRGLDRTLIDQLNYIATQGLSSDLTLWLDLDAAEGLARTQRRGVTDRIEQADLAFHQRVQHGFTQLAQQHGDRTARIDASQTEDLVALQIQAVVEQRFSQWYGNLVRTP